MEDNKGLDSGSWGSMQAYPEKIKFTTDIPVIVTFADDFEEPLEMPTTDGKGVFYIFNCSIEGSPRSINTSSVTLLMGLKGNMPLAGKTLEITKKSVAGKNKFYIHDMAGPKVPTESEEEEIEDY